MEKSMVAAYMLWFFLGYLGAHRFYLNRSRSACYFIVLLVFTIVGFLFLSSYADNDQMTLFGACIAIFTFVCLLAMVIWHLIDAFLIIKIVKKFNLNLYESM
jgi:TM2 domain-containing membrane protein YozV